MKDGNMIAAVIPRHLVYGARCPDHGAASLRWTDEERLVCVACGHDCGDAYELALATLRATWPAIRGRRDLRDAAESVAATLKEKRVDGLRAYFALMREVDREEA